ncbi:MAG: hypothetical protein ABJC13_25610 [Acidobacteriota bacterium]
MRAFTSALLLGIAGFSIATAVAAQLTPQPAASEAAAAVELIGVDETKKEPADLLAGADVLYVPTIIVRRGGKEVGRIVESSPKGIETDLLDLLEGRASGVLSLRTDLAPESPKP